MAKDIPVRQYLANYKVNTFQETIRSFRLNKGLTQNKLAQEMGLFTGKHIGKNIKRYECGERIPDIKNAYHLADVLDINKDSFLVMILREHYKRFTEKHMKEYFEYIKTGKVRKEARYYMCTTGEVSKLYKFEHFPYLLKEVAKKDNITCEHLAEELAECVDPNHKYSVQYISKVISGKECPSVKIAVIICNYFGWNPFLVYSRIVREKAIFHMQNMSLEWGKLQKTMICET
jgi:transcriptional regulator with XRE-family HTH domain